MKNSVLFFSFYMPKVKQVYAASTSSQTVGEQEQLTSMRYPALEAHIAW
jgi:hypothetical protein